MQGKEVFRHAVEKLVVNKQTAMDRKNHLKEGLGCPPSGKHSHHPAPPKDGRADERVVKTVQNHGNTSVASIPLPSLSRSVKANSTCMWVTDTIGGGLAWARLFYAGKTHFSQNSNLLTELGQIVDWKTPVANIQRNRRGTSEKLTRMDLSEAVFREVGLSRNEFGFG